MTITSDKRHDLYQVLIDILGRDEATTLMEHLPPLGWADVATKRDIDHFALVTRRDLEVEVGKLRTEVQAEFAGLRNEISAVEVRFERALREQARTFFLGMLTANATLAGLAFAAAQIT